MAKISQHDFFRQDHDLIMIWAERSRKWGVSQLCDTFLVPLCMSFIMSKVIV